MSGFEVYNEDGKLLIDSENRSTMFYDSRAMTNITDRGFYRINSPFGDGSTLGYSPQAFWNDGRLRWLQFNAGRYGFPGADIVEQNCGRMIRTARNIPVDSGYMDVFDRNGNLVWSALSASRMPRIVKFFDVPAGFDFQNNTISMPLDFNPWILVNNCPGNLSYGGDENLILGYSGVVFRWTGSQLQGRYISLKQKTWAQTFQSRGLRIPLAQFVGV